MRKQERERRVHQLPRGVHIAPMPEQRKITGTGRRLEGGLPPVAYRSSTARWGEGNITVSRRERAPSMSPINMSGYGSMLHAGRRDR